MSCYDTHRMFIAVTIKLLQRQVTVPVKLNAVLKFCHALILAIKITNCKYFLKKH
jgi:hypothetical protein